MKELYEALPHWKPSTEAASLEIKLRFNFKKEKRQQQQTHVLYWSQVIFVILHLFLLFLNLATESLPACNVFLAS